MSNIAILDEINSTNFANIKQIYKPTIDNSGFITALNLTINIKSIPAAEFPYIPDDTPPDVLEQIFLNLESQLQFKELRILLKKGSGSWVEKAKIRIFNKEPYYEVDLMPYFSKANTIDVAEDLSLGIQLKPGNTLTAADSILVFGSALEEKKNDPGLEALGDRLSALESLLGLFGAATSAAAGTNGLIQGAAVGQQDFLLKGDRSWQNPNVFVKTSGSQTINGYLQTSQETFKGAANTGQSIVSNSPTKIILRKVSGSNSQYDNDLSRLVANAAEVWRITTYITFSLSVASRVLLYVYKNGSDLPGVSRIMDSVLSAGFGSSLLTIPEFPLAAGDYIEVYTLIISSGNVSTYGDASLNATYWYGKRLQ